MSAERHPIEEMPAELHCPHTTRPEAGDPARDAALREAADYIIDDCLFAIGQAVGLRLPIDYDAVAWIRDHFHPKFVSAMRAFGNRWLEDRKNVTAVGFMLGERAVRYAAGREVIDVAAVERASLDVERFCQLQSRRSARAMGMAVSGTDQPLIAGYWCTH